MGPKGLDGFPGDPGDRGPIGPQVDQVCPEFLDTKELLGKRDIRAKQVRWAFQARMGLEVILGLLDRKVCEDLKEIEVYLLLYVKDKINAG